jgi:predicted ester cyclase
MSEFFIAIPDAKMTEIDAFADRDKVCVRAEIDGSHQGPLWGVAPTGNTVHWSATFVYRFKEGKLAELWANEDWAAILVGIGYLVSPFDR